jgi:regulator of sigma E protease
MLMRVRGTAHVKQWPSGPVDRARLMLTYPLAFLGAIVILVLIHELGHYCVARYFGVKVLRFSLGFGRVLWSRQIGRDQTEWALCAIPLGGYVKMLDEAESPVNPAERARAFNAQSLLRRALIVLAGPLANLLLAIVLYCGVFMGGVYEFRPEIAPPPAGSPAALAGIPDRSVIASLNGTRVTSWQDLRWQVTEQLLDRDELILGVKGEDGGVHEYHLNAPAGLGNAPERDSLATLGLSLVPFPIEAVIGRIVPQSPAALADIRAGDQVLSVNHQAITEWAPLSSQIRRSPDVAITLEIKRDDAVLMVVATPNKVIENGEAMGRLGIAPVLPKIENDPRADLVHYPLTESVKKAANLTLEMSVMTVRMIGRMITGDVSWKNVTGPVTMADYAGQSAQLGISIYLRFLALISISLGVLNLLPIPVLDGGHLLYYLVEAVVKRPLPEYIINVTQRLGVAVIALLMFVAFYNDIHRLISG